MKLILAIFGINIPLISIFLLPAVAAEQVKIPETNSKVRFSLKDQQSISTSFYPGNSATEVRYYLQFRNQDGNHYLIYDEEESRPPSKTFHALEKIVNSLNATCILDLECNSKPFCTSNCHNMYYQLSNLAPGQGSEEKTLCHLISFTCTKRGESVVSPSRENLDGQKSPTSPSK